MASRLPNIGIDNDEASAAAAAAAAAQNAFLAGWQTNPLAAAAALRHHQEHQQHLQQQQQQQNHQQQAPLLAANGAMNQNNPAASALAAAAAAALSSQANPLAALPHLWPYSALSGSSASMAGLSNNYFNPSMQNPHQSMALHQLFMEFEHQRQLSQLASNPHLLMAAAAAGSPHSHLLAANSNNNNPLSNANNNNNNNGTLLTTVNTSIATTLTNSLPDMASQHHRNNQFAIPSNGIPNLNNGASNPVRNGIDLNNLNISHLLQNHPNFPDNRSTPPTSRSSAQANMFNYTNDIANESAIVNSSSQHQDSLIDQHFRRSLGDDYNQIMASKADKGINVRK